MMLWRCIDHVGVSADVALTHVAAPCYPPSSGSYSIVLRGRGCRLRFVSLFVSLFIYLLGFCSIEEGMKV